MGNFAEWRAAAVSAADRSRCAGRDYYERCDQSVNITVILRTPNPDGGSAAQLRTCATWFARWIVGAAFVGGWYLMLDPRGTCIMPCVFVGGVAFGNLARYAEWRCNRKPAGEG